MEWLETTDMPSLTVLEAEEGTRGVQQGSVAGTSVLGLFPGFLVATGHSRPLLAHGQPLSPSPGGQPLCVCIKCPLDLS